VRTGPLEQEVAVATQPTLINSVVRALNLLDAVGSEPGPVTAKRLARGADLPLATTYHLLRTLVHEGYLDRLEGGYVLGERVSTLAGRRVLAALSDDARGDDLASHPLVDLTPHTTTSRRVLLAELASSPGLTRDREEYAVGTTCLAVPVPSSKVTAAVAISAPVGRAGDATAAERALRRAARLIAISAEV
jgi:IclR family acetate operon transcriptional repressor